MKNVLALAAALLTLSCATMSTPPKPRSPLYDEIARADKELFDAFNAHDAEKVASYFDDGLEFYHDKGGLVTKRDSIAGMKGNFAQNNGLRRDLVGEIEVYPIPNYGAMEIGAHRFCHVENGKNDCGVFKFAHVWQKQAGGWKITRVLSYDH